jgi:hypothetical protein
VTVPDLPGCFSAGASYEETLGNAREAILTHVEGLKMDEEHLTFTSPIETLRKNKKYASNGLWALVSVDLSELSKVAKRVNITLPENVLSKIDAYASKHGETRSGLLAESAMEYMARRSTQK